MASNSPIDPWELAGTILWLSVSGIAFAFEGPRAGFRVAVGLMLVAMVVVASYALLAGSPTNE